MDKLENYFWEELYVETFGQGKPTFNFQREVNINIPHNAINLLTSLFSINGGNNVIIDYLVDYKWWHNLNWAGYAFSC